MPFGHKPSIGVHRGFAELRLSREPRAHARVSIPLPLLRALPRGSRPSVRWVIRRRIFPCFPEHWFATVGQFRPTSKPFRFNTLSGSHSTTAGRQRRGGSWREAVGPTTGRTDPPCPASGTLGGLTHGTRTRLHPITPPTDKPPRCTSRARPASPGHTRRRWGRCNSPARRVRPGR